VFKRAAKGTIGEPVNDETAGNVPNPAGAGAW
jgi:hypothetical protein